MKRIATTCTVLLALASTFRGITLAGPTDGPGPYSFATDVIPSSLWLTFSLATAPEVAGSLPVSIGIGSSEGEFTKNSNDGGTTFPGLDSVQFTGGALFFDDTEQTVDFCGFGIADITVLGITGALTSAVLPVDDADFDGSGTFNPAGSIFLIDQGTIVIDNPTGVLAAPFSTPIVYDFSSSPLALMVDTSTGTIVDPPASVSIDLPDFMASGTLDAPSPAGPLAMNVKLGSVDCGCNVPEPSTFVLALGGILAAAAVIRRRRTPA